MSDEGRPQLPERRVAIVTGAANGIGRAVHTRLTSDGFDVVGFDMVAGEGEGPSSGEIVKVDVSDEDQVSGAVAAVVADKGRIDALCDAAGVLIDTGARLTEMPTESFDKMMAINARGTFLTMKHAIPVLARSRCGAIVNIASTAGVVAQAGSVSYAATKGAVVVLTRGAALDCGPLGITVNPICPGTIETPMIQALPEEAVDVLRALNVVGRFGQAEEVAAMVSFLTSGECTFATGGLLFVDGGRTAT